MVLVPRIRSTRYEPVGRAEVEFRFSENSGKRKMKKKTKNEKEKNRRDISPSQPRRRRKKIFFFSPGRRLRKKLKLYGLSLMSFLWPQMCRPPDQADRRTWQQLASIRIVVENSFAHIKAFAATSNRFRIPPSINFAGFLAQHNVYWRTVCGLLNFIGRKARK